MSDEEFAVNFSEFDRLSLGLLGLRRRASPADVTRFDGLPEFSMLLLGTRGNGGMCGRRFNVGALENFSYNES